MSLASSSDVIFAFFSQFVGSFLSVLASGVDLVTHSGPKWGDAKYNAYSGLLGQHQLPQPTVLSIFKRNQVPSKSLMFYLAKIPLLL